LKYVRPLVGEDWPSVPIINGRQRFARIKPLFADKKLPEYTPEAAR
jgi:6-phosphofructokinase 1